MNINNMDTILVLFLLSLPTAAPNDSYTFWASAIYTKGQTPFPKYFGTMMLNDVRLVYYNGETDTFIGRGNTTNEESVFNSNELHNIGQAIQNRWAIVEHFHKPEGFSTFQVLVLCQLDKGRPGQMITWEALQGSTIDELHWYNGTLNYTAQVPTIDYNATSKQFENLFYPYCIQLLNGFLGKRINQVNRKVKPEVRFGQKSPGPHLLCRATGFYPRDINMTLFRDGQLVADHEITGGDLLPNDDGTYQMRKILEISADEKHIYSCTVSHVSLDNKLSLEYDNRTPLKLVIILIPTVLGLVLISVTVIAIIQAKKRRGVAVVPVFLWRRKHAVPVQHVNSVDSGHSNDSMINDL
ncbi:major histocompatibility complex class I-related gene protein-like isoform X2 [Triplophysa rosa]|uniref:major histocompatibility complex class I-related gene protein-like isoform X2 n=1 Tax=Triplophysa rosa TaxID=992332 RepID=UPI002545C72B|nr:major histocompatibility complex class I-related gene protein-like isoform X2 [Triplophysa rosa]